MQHFNFITICWFFAEYISLYFFIIKCIAIFGNVNEHYVYVNVVRNFSNFGTYIYPRIKFKNCFDPELSII